MNDNAQTSHTVTTQQPESKSALSRASATVGIIGAVFWFIPLLVRLAMYGYPEAIDPSPLM